MTNDYFDFNKYLLTEAANYRNNNPDYLTAEELNSFSSKIFEVIMALNRGKRLDDFKSDELLNNFFDWNEIRDTPSNRVLKVVLEKYPLEKYKNILCVGDGEKCHLGRKLAKHGYNVFIMDPIAKVPDGERYRVFSGFEGYYTYNHPFNNEADLIVGAKVPQIAEHIIRSGKKSIFTLSANPEIHQFNFAGIFIESMEQLESLIKKNYPFVQFGTCDEKSIPILETNGEKLKQDNISETEYLKILKSLKPEEIAMLETYINSRINPNDTLSRKNSTLFFNYLKDGTIKKNLKVFDAIDYFGECVSENITTGIDNIISIRKKENEAQDRSDSVHIEQPPESE